MPWRFFFFLLLSLVLFSPFSSAFAETRYISDQLVISLRDKLNKPNVSVGFVRTADKVKIIGQKGEFARVVTENGIEGWIKKQYLRADLPKKIQVEQLKEEIKNQQKTIAQYMSGSASSDDQKARIQEFSDRLISERDQLQTEVTRLKNSNSSLAGELVQLEEKAATLRGSADQQTALLNKVAELEKTATRLQEDNKKLANMSFDSEASAKERTQLVAERDALLDKHAAIQQQYDTLLKNSQNVVEITRERDELKKSLSTQQADKTLLQARNDELENSNIRQWFLAGAGVLFVGIIFGRTTKKKRNGYTY